LDELLSLSGGLKPSVEAKTRELRANGDGILKIAKTLGVGSSVQWATLSVDGKALERREARH
jgi:hypothetical protein